MADVATLSLAVDSRPMNDATRSMQGMTNAAQLLEGMVQKAIAAFAAWQLMDKAKDAALLAARFETLGVVMGVVGNNAGYTSAEMEKFASSLQAQGISAIESKNALTMMAGAQMDLTKANQIARMAQDAAVIGNLNSSEAFTRMIQAIRSGETEILKTIGIQVSFENAYKKAAKAAKTTTESLSENTKTMIRQNAVLEKAPSIAGAYAASMETAGKQLKSTERYAQDLEVAIGGIFQPSLKVVTKEYTNALKTASEYMEQHKIEADATAEMLGQASRNAADLALNIMSVASASAEVSGDFTLMEIGASALLAISAFIKDAWMNIRGAVESVLSMIAVAVSGTAMLAEKFTNWTWGGEHETWAKNWYNYNLDWAEKAQGMFGANAITAAWNGKPNELPSDNTAKERERIKAASDARKQQEDEAKKRSAAEAATREYKRQMDVVSDLTRELSELGKSEREVTLMRIEAAKLNPAMHDAAVAIANQVAARKALVEVEKELAKLKPVTEVYQENAPIDQRALASLNRSTQLKKYADDINASYQDPAIKMATEAAMLDEALAKNIISLETYMERMRDVRYEGSETWRFLEEAGSSVANSLADAFARMATGAKVSFRELTASILADIARMQAQRGFTALLNMGLSAWASSPTTTTTNYNPGTLDPITVGPTGGGPNLNPVGKRGGTTNETSVIVNVNVASNGTVTTDAGAQQGNDIGRDIAGVVDAWAVKAAAPGGTLWNLGLKGA